MSRTEWPGLFPAQAVFALGLLGLPAAVLSRSGRILVGNRLLRSLVPDVLQDRQKRICLAHRRADALLEAALDSMKGNSDGAYSIPIPASDERPPVIVHLIPVRGPAQGVLGLASAVLVITSVERARVPSAEVLQGLFDLTPAEARVAQAIVGGETVEQIAVRSGVSSGTVRAQLKSIFAKTGQSRQADLVNLLGATALFREQA